jgi:integrase/recombinase XerD
MRGELPAEAPLFATDEGQRLTYPGLRSIIRRRAVMAGIPAPMLHAFRRGFALDSLRNGADIYSLQRMMGHSSLVVLQRYLKQTQGDLQQVHQRSGPVDHLLR